MKSPNPGHAVNGFHKKTHCYTPCCGKMPIPYRHIINNAYIDYLELRLSEIMQFKLEERIHFELIPTSGSRDELGKLSGQRGQGRVKSTGKTDLGLLEI